MIASSANIEDGNIRLSPDASHLSLATSTYITTWGEDVSSF